MNAGNKIAVSVLESPASTGRDKAETRLILERGEVLSELAGLEHLPGDDLAQGWQEVGSPSEETSREIEYGRRDALHRRLSNVNEALERLSAGNYGLCGRCNSKIGARRLEADPAALLCLRCQAFVEGDFKSSGF